LAEDKEVSPPDIVGGTEDCIGAAFGVVSVPLHPMINRIRNIETILGINCLLSILDSFFIVTKSRRS